MAIEPRWVGGRIPQPFLRHSARQQPHSARTEDHAPGSGVPKSGRAVRDVSEPRAAVAPNAGRSPVNKIGTINPAEPLIPIEAALSAATRAPPTPLLRCPRLSVRRLVLKVLLREVLGLIVRILYPDFERGRSFRRRLCQAGLRSLQSLMLPGRTVDVAGKAS